MGTRRLRPPCWLPLASETRYEQLSLPKHLPVVWFQSTSGVYDNDPVVVGVRKLLLNRFPQSARSNASGDVTKTSFTLLCLCSSPQT